MRYNVDENLVEDDVGSNKNAEALQQISDDVNECGFDIDVARAVGRSRACCHRNNIIIILLKMEFGIINRICHPPRSVGQNTRMTVTVTPAGLQYQKHAANNRNNFLIYLFMVSEHEAAAWLSG